MKFKPPDNKQKINKKYKVKLYYKKLNEIEKLDI